MEGKPRSPSYPSLNLRDALDRIRSLHAQIGQSPHSREVVAHGLGYSSLSGASATAISALRKYGLLEGRADEVRVSDRAMAILHPHSEEERQEALQAAASEPELFRELAGKFPDARVGDELLRNYLLRNRFAPKAVDEVISSYRDTLEFVGGFRGSKEMRREPPQSVDVGALSTPVKITSGAARNAQNLTLVQADERRIGVVDLEGGQYVRIVASYGIDTEDALEWAEDIISRKRRELRKLKGREPEVRSNAKGEATDQDMGAE